MARRSPSDKLAHLHTIAAAWHRLRPTRSYAGLTLAQFKRAIQPSYDTRAEIAELRKRLRNAIIGRDRADFHSLRHAERVVFAVQGDPDEGSDGLLYAEMGYVRRSARRRRRRQKT